MKRSKLLIYCLTIVIILPSFANSKPGNYTFGLQGGLFSPKNWAIQGMSGYLDYWSGFGRSYELDGYLGYNISDFELRLEAAQKWANSKSDYSHFNSFVRDGKDRLQVTSIDLSLICHFNTSNNKIIPYLGFGTGINFASWQHNLSYANPNYGDINDPSYPHAEDFINQKVKGNSQPLGVHIRAGCEVPVNQRLYFSGEIKYSYISSSWSFKDDNGKIDDYGKPIRVSLGGTSMRFGIGYRF